MYFVPRTERAMEFARTFIIGGVGYDIYPRSFENLARLAALDDPLTPCLADAHVIFGDAAALAKLHELQEILRRHLADAAYMRAVAEKRFTEACENVAVPGYLLTLLSEVIAALNSSYFRYGIKRQYAELAAMPAKPADFLAGYDAIVQNPTRDNCEALFHMVGTFAGFAVTPAAADAAEVQKAQDAADVASLYEEISSTFGKIYTAAELGDARYAFLAASCLAGELAWTGWRLPSLMGAWNAEDLPAFAAHTQAVEAALVHEIEARGAKIRRYADFTEFAENIK